MIFSSFCYSPGPNIDNMSDFSDLLSRLVTVLLKLTLWFLVLIEFFLVPRAVVKGLDLSSLIEF